jgi:hypothetical protein
MSTTMSPSRTTAKLKLNGGIERLARYRAANYRAPGEQ